jgi:hypothetical protein
MYSRKIMQQFVSHAALLGRHAIEAALLLKRSLLVAKYQIHDADPDAEEQEKL